MTLEWQNAIGNNGILLIIGSKVSLRLQINTDYHSLMIIVFFQIDRDYSDMFLKEIRKYLSPFMQCAMTELQLSFVIRYPSVKYLGQLPQPELFLLLKHSFALVNSSLNEGMSNVILEVR